MITDIKKLAIATILILIATASANATITFEGFGPLNQPGMEGEEIPSLTRQGVTVTFLTEDTNGNQFIPVLAEAGSPRLAFQSALGDDMPAGLDGNPYGRGGNFSLTNEIRNTRDYVIGFSQSVASVSLDLYDFRSDGPHNLGTPGSDTVRFNAYNAAGNIIASDSYTVSNPRPIEGNVAGLSVAAPGITEVRVEFNTLEGGTAIDNLQFTVPEPSSLGLASFGLVALLGCRRRRKAA